MSENVLLTSVENGVRTITLNRPDRRNALNGELLARLGEAFVAADGDPDTKVVVLTGSDPAFCAGADLQEVAGQGGGIVSRFALDEAPPEFFSAESPISKPLIGAINGAAYAGGLMIALLCDVLIASERAVFADTHVKVGIPPGGAIVRRLERRVGPHAARYLLWTGKKVDGALAYRLGLAEEVVPHDELVATAQRIGETIAGHDERIVSWVKRVSAEGSTMSVPDAAALETRELRAWASSISNADVMDRAKSHLTATKG